MTHINFVILNSHVTVTYLRFIKGTYVYNVEKLKIAAFLIIYKEVAFFKQEKGVAVFTYKLN